MASPLSAFSVQRELPARVLASSCGAALVTLTSIVSAAPGDATIGSKEAPSAVAAPEAKPYRAPLAAWYAVALGVTWIPVALSSGCRGVECSTLLIGPTLRLGFAFAPPIVHWNRGHVGRGFLSLGGQIAAVAIGANVGSAASHAPNCPDAPDSACPPNLGPFIGWLVADVVWATVDVIATPATASVPATPSVASATPTLDVTRSGATLGLRGAF